MFALLYEFRKREGNTIVPSQHVENGEKLGSWLYYQRTLMRKGNLPKEKLEQLESLGVVATASARQLKWDKMFELLSKYRDREGHLDVPQSHKEDGESLGSWLAHQRKMKREKKLAKEKVDKLERLEVGNAQETIHLSNQHKLETVGVVFGEHTWKDMYQRLVHYQQQYGHSSVPQSYKDKDGKNLGTWLNTQRQSKKRGTLDQKLQGKLEAVDGFAWEISPGMYRWDAMFSLLRDYYEVEGHCNVPKDYTIRVVANIDDVQEKRLGSWLNQQRRSKLKGNLGADRQRRLESLGVVWDLSIIQWEEMFVHLRDFREREGHSNVPNRYKVETSFPLKNLGAWLQTQRRLKQEGTLDQNRRERLENLDVQWEIYSKWEKLHHLLVQYQEREGNCLVPQNHLEEGKTLGIWLNNQRSRKKSGTLTKEQCSALEDLGVVWDVAPAQWDSMFNLLVQFQLRTGHCRVPQTHKENGKNLGTWLNVQRQAKRNGTLDRAKEQELEKIGMVWNVASESWDEMLALVVRYKEREGDCLVPLKHTEDDKTLGTWLDLQRRFQKRGTLDPEKERQLTEIGMIWDKLTYKWEVMYSRLLEYKEREGDCSVPALHMEDGQGLGAWLNLQRKLHKNGNLDPLRQKRLEDVGVVFNRNKQRWESMFALLVQFREREGHCRVPQNHKEGVKQERLGSWLDSQRQKKKKEKLDFALQTRLEKVGVEWSIYTTSDMNDDDDWGFEGMDHLFDDNDLMAY
ncbi:unnamed protein product [Pseudo-nitzschia multistriata]|uniref:Helicase-associated domain-containing protein n=1 Tax=Pseudo-nitzschia multistriata TaxID=183589 RepID=A0A448Z9G0_9STRA|nr:unnamed protein product [Pseudo-nitzschia multistriata]